VVKMKVVCMIGVVTLFLLVGDLAKAGTVRLLVEGKEVWGDVPPIVVLIPVRDVAEAMGIAVVWDPGTNSVTLEDGERQIVLVVGQAEALVDGKPEPLDLPIVMHRGRTMVPLSFVSEHLGADVTWDPASGDVHVTPVKSTLPPESISPEETRKRALALLSQTNVQDRFKAEAHYSLRMSLGDDSLSMTRTVNQVLYTSGTEMLRQTTTRLFGEDLLSGTAIRGETVWRLNPSSAVWEQGNYESHHDWLIHQRLDNPLALVELTEEELSMATVTLSEEINSGEVSQVVTLSWGLPMVAELVGDQMAELVEGRMSMRFWFDEAGLTQRIDIELFALDQVEPANVMEATGQILFTPWNEPIPFPDEILQPVDSESDQPQDQ